MKEFHFSPHGSSVREENFFHTRFLCYFVCFFRLTLRPSSTKNAIFLWFVKHCRHHHQTEKNNSVFLFPLSNAFHRVMVLQMSEFGAHKEEGRVFYFALHLEVNSKVLMKPCFLTCRPEQENSLIKDIAIYLDYQEHRTEGPQKVEVSVLFLQTSLIYCFSICTPSAV